LPGGSPLAPEIRRPLEKSFSTNLQDVRVHTDVGSHNVAHGLSTRAVTYGNDIYLGRGERATDMRVMAHEAAHVVQQRGAPATAQLFSPASDSAYEAEAEQASAAVLRGESFSVQQQTGPRPQGLLGISLPDPLDWLANKANIIPGFRLLTIILGVNPINMSPVARSGANILRAMIEILPGGGLVSQALESSGIFEKAGAFVEKQIASLGMTGSAIKTAVTSFINGLSLRRIITDPGGVWASAKSIFTTPIEQIKNFWVGLITGLVELVKEAILKPIAKLAEGTEGYNLLKGILGKDPITNEPVTRSAETLLGPLLKMIGLGDVWQKMQDAKAIPRAWAWFQSTMGELLAIVSAIPPAFIGALKSLTLEDIILIPKAFIKLGKVFVGFMGKFVSWGANAMWELLKIVFDVVSPGAFGYIQRTGAALKSILKNPLPFVGNLAKAAMLGFKNFGGNFLTHLKNGLIDWLTGSLTGIYIPKALTLLEFGKMALSVLGLSWAQIRGKIVKALGPNGELIMQGLEAAFDVVKALVTGGPAAAWEVLKDKLTGLKDQIVSGITSMVVEAVVTKGIPKLVAMFIPGAGFISAIISIYDMIMVFVNKISQIIAVVTAFLDSIVAIAAGNIGAAAGKVESILARLLALAINFLAGFAGLGKVADKIRGIVARVRDTVDKALDAAIAFIINKAKALFAYLFGKKGKEKEKPKGPKEGTAQKGFSLPKEGHTVTAKAQGGKQKVVIASQREVDILNMLSDAAAEVTADTTRDAAQKAQILSDLSGARGMVNSMGQDYLAASPNIDYQSWAEVRLTTIINILTHLGADGIKAFADFKGKPLDKRYLPGGYDVRQNLYLTGSGWSGNRTAVINAGRTQVLNDVDTIVNNRTTNPAVATAAWNRLKNGLRAPKGSTMATISKAWVQSIQYDVDHIDSLASHWESGGGNNTGDGARWALSNTGNLRYITQADNLALPKGKYKPWVGKAFVSARAQGGLANAKTIDGQPFLDGPGGSPI
jgi:hypothetical protein